MWTNPSDVDIDHMVPLSEAWKSGAYAWTAEQRRAYANDLGLGASLVAVTDNVNQSKGDSDPASWMPPASSVTCRYATDWVLVKYRWNLSIDSAESTVLNGILAGGCGTASVDVPAKGGTLPAGGNVQRISGADRYATAVAVAGQYATGVPVVYVASGANFPDALSAAPAAAMQGGPLLLTAPTALPGNVAVEIRRLAPALIVVVGGPASITENVYTELSTLAPSIRRDAGSDRYATSRAVNAAAFGSGATSAFVATGKNFPDALSASAVAGGSTSPVLLVDGAIATADHATLALMASLGIVHITVVGGPAAVSAAIESDFDRVFGAANVKRLSGADRYLTSSAINRGSFTSSPVVYLATGTGFADALAGAALAGRDDAALYVIPGNCVPDYVISDLQALGTTRRILLGGVNAQSPAIDAMTPCAPPPAPAAPAPPAPPAPPSIPANPGDIVNCNSFSTWSAAQAWFDTYYPYYGDVGRLDGDNNGVACQSLPGHP
ncbi:cell wall-binding repeat-containing protein [Cryobacterium sp. TMS1-13-1]|uniref:cell wall-binding repeat-containing protein n=1 Tax=Cryobacterium sp. TMS1-13-1 TaxID=1259220 RepID=UPI001F54224E|nr:cell wall-binding repeat-containing protein [Cryobacterium sp. TMS1-13-1]